MDAFDFLKALVRTSHDRTTQHMVEQQKTHIIIFFFYKHIIVTLLCFYKHNIIITLLFLLVEYDYLLANRYKENFTILKNILYIFITFYYIIL